MTRSSDIPGSYREWAAEQRAADQAEKHAEQQRKARERDRLAQEAIARDDEATAKTAAVDRQIATLQALLRESLSRDPRIDLATLHRRAKVPPLELGQLARPLPAPQWTDFEPEPPRAFGRMFGGQARYEAACEQARRAFARAQADHRHQEAQRHRQVSEARQAHDRQAAEAQRQVDAHNAHVDQLEAGLRQHDRHAVSEYVQIVLDRSPYPAQFPARRSAGYVPESSLLAIEWYLPLVDVVPKFKTFRHIKTRKVIEPTLRPVPEVRQLYQSVIAQIALRTLREIFAASPEDLISTVVFNGRVRDTDPLTGQKIQPHLITLRATREKFTTLILDEPKFNPVECVRRYFFADISPHPDDRRGSAGTAPAGGGARVHARFGGLAVRSWRNASSGHRSGERQRFRGGRQGPRLASSDFGLGGGHLLAR